VEQLFGGLVLDGASQGGFERAPAYAALEQLEGLITLVEAEPVDQQLDVQAIQKLDAGVVHLARHRDAQIKREKIEVVVGTQRVTVVLDVAADLQMPAGIEQRPRRYGKAQSAHVEILEPRALLREYFLDPGKPAGTADGGARAWRD